MDFVFTPLSSKAAQVEESNKNPASVLEVVHFGDNPVTPHSTSICLEGSQRQCELSPRMRVYIALTYTAGSRRLEQIGLVELFLESPKRYSAVEPEVAISALINKFESKVRALQGSAPSLESRLEAYRKINEKQAGKAESFELGAYRLVVGRGEILSRNPQLSQGIKV